MQQGKATFVRGVKEKHRDARKVPRAVGPGGVDLTLRAPSLTEDDGTSHTQTQAKAYTQKGLTPRPSSSHDNGSLMNVAL